MKIEKLYPCSIDEHTGKLERYDKNNTITITRKGYCISSNSEIFYETENTNEMKHTDYSKINLKGKHIYRIRNSNNNNEEIYVKLNFIQNIKFKIITFNLTKLKSIITFILNLFKK